MNSLVSTEIVIIKPTLVLDIVVVGSAGIFEVRVLVTESCYDSYCQIRTRGIVSQGRWNRRRAHYIWCHNEDEDERNRDNHREDDRKGKTTVMIVDSKRYVWEWKGITISNTWSPFYQNLS